MRCFLALDKSLAYARHYPAINWTMSYSEYYEDLDPYYTEHLGEKFCTMRGRILGLLSEENKLMEIVKLIGSDVLPDSQRSSLRRRASSGRAFCSRTLSTKTTPMCRWTNRCG